MMFITKAEINPIEQPPTATMEDLPLVPDELKGKGKHLLDVLKDWKWKVDKADVKTKASLGHYSKLPEPFRPKSNWDKGYSMQLVLPVRVGAQIAILVSTSVDFQTGIRPNCYQPQLELS